MKYPKIPALKERLTEITYYAKYKHEQGNTLVSEKLEELEREISRIYHEIKTLEEPNYFDEPSSLEEIRKQRPKGPRKLMDQLPSNYDIKLKGALLSRLAGCILGSPVEFYSVKEMEEWAAYHHQKYPLETYWNSVKSPGEIRYGKSDFKEYTSSGMQSVPVDDDIVYTVLNLLLMEEKGLSFTTKDVGDIWLKYLPYACTAEDVALQNLKQQLPMEEVGVINNPYLEWIGADIRSDAFAYVAPGYPEKAAELAYYDAYLSHRKNGIYGEMFFAAAQSAAFVVDDPIEAIRIGLTEIPQECQLADAIHWALDSLDEVSNYNDARQLVDQKFEGMEHAHTINNACLVVFGLHIGKTDITKVIGEIVAMGMDNDCNAATAGSIVGAIATFDKLDATWYNNFNDKVETYLHGIDSISISSLLVRFKALAKSLYASL